MGHGLHRYALLDSFEQLLGRTDMHVRPWVRACVCVYACARYLYRVSRVLYCIGQVCTAAYSSLRITSLASIGRLGGRSCHVRAHYRFLIYEEFFKYNFYILFFRPSTPLKTSFPFIFIIIFFFLKCRKCCAAS